MTDTPVPISELPDASLPLAGTEPVPLVQGGVTCQAPASAFAGAHVAFHVTFATQDDPGATNFQHGNPDGAGGSIDYDNSSSCSLVDNVVSTENLGTQTFQFEAPVTGVYTFSANVSLQVTDPGANPPPDGGCYIVPQLYFNNDTGLLDDLSFASATVFYTPGVPGTANVVPSLNLSVTVHITEGSKITLNFENSGIAENYYGYFYSGTFSGFLNFAA